MNPKKRRSNTNRVLNNKTLQREEIIASSESSGLFAGITRLDSRQKNHKNPSPFH